MNDAFHSERQRLRSISSGGLHHRSCPVTLATYATLHLDSIGKILNHVLAITLWCDLCLFLSSFSISYMPQAFGFNTVFLSFVLSAITVVDLLIINNNRISALSILAPTEFMVGVAAGFTILAAVVAGVVSSTYKTVTVCDKLLTTSAPATTTSTNATAAAATDPVLMESCTSHKSAMTHIWFWAGLVAWLNAVAAMLLVAGRRELSASQHPAAHSYETIGEHHNNNNAPNSLDCFEENFRRQQAAILGAQQAADLQQRATAMHQFVGDYASVPEVTSGASSAMSTVTLNSSSGGNVAVVAAARKGGGGGRDPNILSV